MKEEPSSVVAIELKDVNSDNIKATLVNLLDDFHNCQRLRDFRRVHLEPWLSFLYTHWGTLHLDSTTIFKYVVPLLDCQKYGTFQSNLLILSKITTSIHSDSGICEKNSLILDIFSKNIRKNKELFFQAWIELFEQTLEQDHESRVKMTIMSWEYWIVKLFLSLPNKLQKLQNVESTLFTEREFYPNLTLPLKVFIESVPSYSQNNSPPMDAIRLVLLKLCRLGHSDIIAQSLLLIDANIYKDLASLLFMDMPFIELDKMVLCILHTMNKKIQRGESLDTLVMLYRYMQSYINPIFECHSVFKSSFILKALKIFSGLSFNLKHALLHLVFHKQKFGDLEKEVLIFILETWSDKSNIQSLPEDVILNLVKIIVVALVYIDRESHILDAYLTNSIIKGVQGFLESPNANIRAMGMYVGELFSKVCKAEVKLNFDLDESYGIVKDLKLTYLNAHNLLDDTKPIICLESFAEELISKDEPKKDETLDDNNDTEMFFPKEDVKTPRYIRDSIAYLKSTDNSDKIKASLNVLPDQILQESILTLEELGPTLVHLLLFLTNEYELNGLEESKVKGLMSLLIRIPEMTTRILIEEFYSRNLVLQQRLEILSLFATAAREWCTPEMKKKITKVQNADDDLKDSLHQAFVKLTLHSSRQTEDSKKVSFDSFSSLAPLLFYGILSPKLIQSEHLKCMSELIYEKVILCLTCIVIASLHSISFLNMTKDMVHFLVSFFMKDLCIKYLSLRTAVLRSVYILLTLLVETEFVWAEWSTLFAELERLLIELSEIEVDGENLIRLEASLKILHEKFENLFSTTQPVDHNIVFDMNPLRTIYYK